MATQENKNNPMQTRLELIKKRHEELILKPQGDLMDGLLEEDDAFASLDDSDELGYYEDYADVEMEV